MRILFDRLKSEDFEPWFDEDSLIGGQDWEHEILKAIKSSDVILVCLSIKAITKIGYVQKEIARAIETSESRPEGAVFVIPLRLEECDIPRRLIRWQVIDFFAEDGFHRLVRALRAAAPPLSPSSESLPPKAVEALENDKTPTALDGGSPSPFCDAATNQKIKARILRLQAAALEWSENPEGRSFDDFILDTLTSSLEAHAEAFLDEVNSSELIEKYSKYLRGVGDALIWNAQERRFLRDPERDSDHQSFERDHPSAESGWRSEMLLRIETRFEVQYRNWTAKAIDRVHGVLGPTAKRV